MSWIRDHTLSWLQRLSLAVLRGGPIPHHVAIIMDGNRRFAVKSNMRKVEGHSKGFDKLSEVLQWCLDIGIYEVTVYAFSIENFKRTKEEVDQVLKLADEKFAKLLEEKDKLKELGIRVRVIGNMDLLPDTLKAKIAEATLETKDHDKAVLNVALAYTSRDEMTHSMISILDGIERGELTESDVDDHLLSKCLYTNERPTADLLIRTSGETRISDFLLWQASNSVIYFTDVLWPEFQFWHLWQAVFQYQRALYADKSYAAFQRNERTCNETQDKRESPKIKKFLANVNDRQIAQLEDLWKSTARLNLESDDL